MMKSERWGCWLLVWLLWMSVGMSGCPRVRRNPPNSGPYGQKNAQIIKALRILARMRKHQQFTAVQDAESLGLIERYLYSDHQNMRFEARQALLSFGAKGADVWRRLLVWRKGEASHSYYLREALGQMRMLGKEIKPLLPDLMRLLYVPDNSVYWAVLGILQAGGDIACGALGESWRALKLAPSVGGLEITKAFQRTLLTMARISPTCRAQWEEALIGDLALQGQVLGVLRQYIAKDSMAYLRLLLENKDQIVTENRVVWREVIRTVLWRVRSEASTLRHSRVCRTKKLRDGKRFHIWGWEDVQAVMSSFREALRVGKGREALFGDTYASRVINANMISEILAVVEALAYCDKSAVFDLFVPSFRGHDRHDPNIQPTVFYHLQRHAKAHVAWLHKQYTQGKGSGCRLAFRLLAIDPQTTGLAVGEMLEVLSGSDEEMALWAMQGLGQMGPNAAMAFPAVMRWAEKGWEGKLSMGQRKIAQQALATLTAIGIQSKVALSMCVRHWKEVEDAHQKRHPNQSSQEIARRCYQALRQAKEPWKIETVEGWSALLRSLKQQRWSLLVHTPFLQEGGERSDALWKALYRLAANVHERQQILMRYRSARWGKEITDLTMIWEALRDGSPILQQEALVILHYAKNQDKALIAWLLAFLHPSKKRSALLRAMGMTALGQVGRKSAKVRKMLLRWLWKVPLTEQASVLLALQAQKGRGGCEIAQELLELYGKAHPQMSLILQMMYEQSSCMRLVFPMLWRLTKQTNLPHSGTARSYLSSLFRIQTKAILSMVSALPKHEQQGWWGFHSPIMVYQPQALQDLFSLLDASDPNLQEIATYMLERLQGIYVHSALFAPVLFSELSQSHAKRRYHAVRLLGESGHIRGWLGWLKQDPKRYVLIREIFLVLVGLDATVRNGLLSRFAWIEEEVLADGLRWALVHPKPAVRLVAVDLLNRRSFAGWAAWSSAVEKCLRTGTQEVRRSVLDGLWLRKQRIPALLPVMRGVLRDKDQGVRWTAGYWVAWMGDSAAIPVLREILASGNVLQRREVVGVFRELKRESASLLPDVRAILTKEKDSSVIASLLYSLAEWEEGAAGLGGVLEPFAAGMVARYLYRHAMIRLLARIGKKASWSAPYLWALAAKGVGSDIHAFLELAEALGRTGMSLLPKVLAELR